jgi:hypothetical protein
MGKILIDYLNSERDAALEELEYANSLDWLKVGKLQGKAQTIDAILNLPETVKMRLISEEKGEI